MVYAEERPLLLIVVDWKERALILAELQERGYDVRALPGIVPAIGYLIRRPHLVPRLIILDITDDPDVNERTLKDLMELASHCPWVVITSATRSFTGRPLLQNKRAVLLSRPLAVGAIVEAVEQALAKSGGEELGR